MPPLPKHAVQDAVLRKLTALQDSVLRRLYEKHISFKTFGGDAGLMLSKGPRRAALALERLELVHRKMGRFYITERGIDLAQAIGGAKVRKQHQA